MYFHAFIVRKNRPILEWIFTKFIAACHTYNHNAQQTHMRFRSFIMKFAIQQLATDTQAQSHGREHIHMRASGRTPVRISIRNTSAPLLHRVATAKGVVTRKWIMYPLSIQCGIWAWPSGNGHAILHSFYVSGFFEKEKKNIY